MSNLSNNNLEKKNEQIQKSILICGILSMIIIIILVISIIIYCICKNRRESKNAKNHNIFIEEKQQKKNNTSPEKFKPVSNSSTIGSDNVRQNMSMSEIKEKNLKHEIHNIIHSSNVNTDSERKKKKKKNGKKSHRDDSPRNNLENKMNEINEISTKKLENDIKNQIKQFVRDDDEKK